MVRASNPPPLLQCPLGLAVTMCMRALQLLQPEDTAIPLTLVSFCTKQHLIVSLHSSNLLSHISGHADEARAHDSLESQMLQYLTREEQQSVLHTSAASDIEDLEQFARYVSC